MPPPSARRGGLDRVEKAIRDSVDDVGRIYIESRRVDVEDARPLPAAR